ncbi:inovirus-type Gp2 protein [Pectobacterium actinidiae]|uniref:YagK/YfjJ domain-containing protein n=1 Tax=Pectobacterium actinidiae TaxID=1507808 RepID=UPI002A81CCDB|nr:inovirus-type Gp2 protein [Pectobacterium actinidiae]MDY4315667.1 inovirus-type Gp2 protein [Pectobacterium actinidiae]
MANSSEILLSCAVIEQIGNKEIINITNDSIVTEDLHHIYKQLCKIRKIKQPPYVIDYENNKTYQTRCGDAVINLIHRLSGVNVQDQESRRLNPLIIHFHKLLAEHNLFSQIYNGKLVHPNETETARKLNQLITEYRCIINSNAFRQENRKYHRASVKNLRGVNSYINHLFSRYARLLVVRLDLSWGKQFAKEMTAEQAKKQRQHLFRNMKKNALFKHVLGVIWKLEYGKDKGFHYHMLFFLDGNKARCDINISRQFGEYWQNIITEGKGMFFNCNARIAQYEKPGIGMVRYTDADKREGLMQAVKYLTKIDTFARLALPGNARTFGRGEIRPFRVRGRKRLALPKC